MPRRRARIPLHVFLNARLTGTLTRQASGAIEFRYAPGWLAWEHALPVSLSLPLREERFSGGSVQAVFDNLLPDGDAMRRRIAEQVHAQGHDVFSLLAAIGRDCVGALQMLPEGEEPGPAGAVAGKVATPQTIAQTVRELAEVPLGMRDEGEFRISIAGAQEKTALLRWRGRWHIPSGSTATTHILKPQIGRLRNGVDLSQSVENEYLCLRLAKAFGLRVAGAEISDFDNVRVLVVERFDRHWTRNGRLLRVPQEDFCQALGVPSAHKYELDGGPGIREALELLRGSDDPEADQKAFFRAQIIFWLLGATDGHAKNFSVHLLPGGRFRLAPTYDIMSVQPYIDAHQLPWKRAKLAMAIGDRRRRQLNSVMPRHFLQTAGRARMHARGVEQTLAEITGTVEHALGAAEADLPDGFPKKLAASIFAGVRARAKLLTQ